MSRYLSALLNLKYRGYKMYLDKVLKAMTKEDKKDILKPVGNIYSPKRQENKKYKGNLVYNSVKGELKYW